MVSKPQSHPPGADPPNKKPITNKTTKKHLAKTALYNQKLTAVLNNILRNIAEICHDGDTNKAFRVYWSTRQIAVQAANALDPNFKPTDHH